MPSPRQSSVAEQRSCTQSQRRCKLTGQANVPLHADEVSDGPSAETPGLRAPECHEG